MFLEVNESDARLQQSILVIFGVSWPECSWKLRCSTTTIHSRKLRGCLGLGLVLPPPPSRLATYYSPLTTYDLLLNTNHSLLTAHYRLLTTYSLLTTYDSLPTTHYVILTTHDLLLTIHYFTTHYSRLLSYQTELHKGQTSHNECAGNCFLIAANERDARLQQSILVLSGMSWSGCSWKLMQGMLNYNNTFSFFLGCLGLNVLGS